MENSQTLADALGLPAKECAEIAAQLIIASLGPVSEALSDKDVLVEAARRDLEMDADPSTVLSHEQFMATFESRRK